MQPLVDPVINKITDLVVEKIGCHISYAWNYSDNIQRLTEQVNKLKDEKRRVKNKVKEAKRNNQDIEDHVNNWLSRVKAAINRAEQIKKNNDDANRRCFMGCRPNLLSRYKLGKEANRETSLLEGLLKETGQSTFENVGYNPALQVITSVKDYEDFASRTQIFNQILEALKKGDVNKIGMSGTCGVGKSIIAKKVAEQVKKDGTFSEVVLASVSQKVDLKRIQQQIAEQLGHKLDKEFLEMRAAQLRTRLKREDNILIILDDVWAKIKVEDIGIPFGREHPGCKIWMISRDENVLSELDIEKKFKLEALEDGEALQLFEKRVGTPEHQEMNTMASKIVRTCAGLPGDIVVVAKALKNKELWEWKHCLNQLKRSEDDMSGVELSYNFIKNDEIKSLFLLCGSHVCFSYPVDDLLKYVVGMNLFKRCTTLEEARIRLQKYISDLKSSGLMMEGDRVGEVKMLNNVRSFAISVASRDRHVFSVTSDSLLEWPKKDELEQFTAIDLNQRKIPELPTTFACPNLQSFLLVPPVFGSSLIIPNGLFSMTKGLTVLELTGLQLVQLPSSIQNLENLQTLCLNSCELKDVSMIGNLINLKVLSLCRSDIAGLPRELEQLTRLQFLDLSHCSSLEVIPANVLSKLVQLEDLRMGNSFVHWEGERQDGEGINASLSELRAFSNLVALDIHIRNANMLSRDLFSEKLERFKIFIGDGWGWSDGYGNSRVLKLKLELNSSIQLERVKVLLKKAEELHLDEMKDVENVLDELDEEGFPHLKQLCVKNSHDFEFIIDWTWKFIAFPSLESLSLQNLKNLGKMYSGHYVRESFSKLRIIKVGNCNKLNNLFSFSMLKGLMQLEEIDVRSCQVLKAIVDAETSQDSDGEEAIELLQLKSLKLEKLPKLSCFCSQEKDDESAFVLLFLRKKIHFPKLAELRLTSINVKEIWSNPLKEMSSFSKKKRRKEISSSWIKNLTTLIVDSCGDLSYLFTSSVVGSLEKLKVLEVSNCKSMKEIVDVEGAEIEIVFCELDSLKLKGLHSLQRFCTAKLIKCPSLKVLRIENCPHLREFISDSTSAYAGSSSGAGRANSALFDKKVFFPNVEGLEITDMHTLERIWHDELGEDSFCKLKWLTVKDGKKLLNFFPSKHLQRFKNLYYLEIDDCELVEEIFDLREETNVNTAFELTILIIQNLPKLKNVWNRDPRETLSFHNLQCIVAERCPNLKSLFPFSVAQNLQQLELISIENCSGIKEIVAKGESVQGTPKFAFPRLACLELGELPELQYFYPEKHILKCRQLQDLSIIGCYKLQVFTSDPELHPNEIQESQSKVHQVPQSLFSFNKVIPKLNTLSFHRRDISMIQEGQFPSDRLEFLQLEGFHDNSAESSFTLQRFSNIKKLGLTYCNFSVLFPHDILVEDKRVLNQLQYLELTRLPHLCHISEDSQHGDVLQNLEALNIEDCTSLITLAPPSVSFQNLSTLEVSGCHALVKLIASSTAMRMAKLTKLTVTNNDQLTEIVADEGDGSQSQTKIIFNNLETLELRCLKNLTVFCSIASCRIEFPSLNDVVVEQCPKMKIFSQGTLSSPKLKRVYLTDDGDKELWTENLNTTIKQMYEEMVGFSGMGVLQLSEFPQLKEVWHNQLPIQLFWNLKELVIDDCPFTPNAVPLKLLPFLDKLTTLEVRNCNAVATTVEWPNANGSVGHLSNLTCLTVCGCGNLKYLFTLSMIRSVVRIQSIEISDCEKMQQVIVSMELEEETMTGENEMLLSELSSLKRENEMLLSELSSLKLENLPELAQFCTADLLSCPSLEELQIRNCPVLKTFVSNAASALTTSNSGLEILNSSLFDEKVWFPSLDSVVINDCDSVEGVFAPQVLGKTQEADVVEASQLRYLDIRGLRNLKNVWNVDPCGIPSYHNLQKLYARDCPNLKNLIPFSIAQNLPQLEVLNIDGCGLEEIVAKEERVESAPKFIIPRLKSFVIWRSQELKHFYPGTHTLECPMLEFLSVCHCDKLEVFATKSVEKNLPDTQMEYPLFSFKEIVPNLEELSLTSKDATMIQQSQFPESFFRKLKVVVITCYHDESAVFPFDLLERFYNMEKLEVRFSQFKELFPHELVGKECYVKTMKLIRFLTLANLADLKHIWHQDSQLLDQVLQSLEILQVYDCDSLVTLAPSAASFQNLTSMDIQSCKALASLLTFSTAKSLLQLKTLSIKECNMLAEIVVSVGNDGSKEEIILAKLQTLKLVCLPSLISFCSAEHSFFQFPSLTQVIVQQCPKMQVFSNGALSTPKLKLLQVTEEEDDKGHWSGDLNATIQHLFTKTNAEESNLPSTSEVKL